MGQGVKVRSGDGFIRDGFPEEVALKMGSEELRMSRSLSDRMANGRDASGRGASSGITAEV